MYKTIENNMVLLVLGTLSIIEMIITQKSPEIIFLLLPYGLYKLIKWILDD